MTTQTVSNPRRAPTGPPETADMNPWLLWRTERPEEPVLTVAELSECCCPELCDRDHANE